MKYFFLTVLVILFSCTTSDKPENLIEKEKMSKLIMEIHLLEAKINHVPITPQDSTQAVYEHFEQLLFEDFGVTKEQYEISFNYYVANPNEFEKIYTTTVDSLLQKEKRYK
ncbi:MAG: DUF4296 domain-containing protein [Bacteroidota bacterium]